MKTTNTNDIFINHWGVTTTQIKIGFFQTKPQWNIENILQRMLEIILKLVMMWFMEQLFHTPLFWCLFNLIIGFARARFRWWIVTHPVWYLMERMKRYVSHRWKFWKNIFCMNAQERHEFLSASFSYICNKFSLKNCLHRKSGSLAKLWPTFLPQKKIMKFKQKLSWFLQKSV